MCSTQNRFVNQLKMRAPFFFAAALGLFIAGCSSSSTAPTQTPAPQAVLPPPALTGDQMAKLCQADPDTCHRVQTAQPLTVDDVKAMARLGFSSDVIIAVVRNSHTVYHLTANQIIDLNSAGLSNQVIDFLISTPTAVAGTTAVPEPQTNPSGAQTPPPAPPSETATAAPGPDYVWVDGDWVWNSGWVWVGGHWVVPPYPGALWFHGGWGRGWGRGFRHRPGRWR
jgi:hypothetical protein